MSALPTLAAHKRILAAVSDLRTKEAAALLRLIADELDPTGTTPAAEPATKKPKQKPACRTTSPAARPERRKGCPSEAAYRRHLAAGEKCQQCRDHMNRVEAERLARHPEWRSRSRRGVAQ